MFAHVAMKIRVVQHEKCTESSREDTDGLCLVSTSEICSYGRRNFSTLLLLIC